MSDFNFTSRQLAAFHILFDPLLPRCSSRSEDASGRGRGITRVQHLCRWYEDATEHDVLDVDRLVATAEPMTLDRVHACLLEACGRCFPEDHLLAEHMVNLFCHHETLLDLGLAATSLFENLDPLKSKGELASQLGAPSQPFAYAAGPRCCHMVGDGIVDEVEKVIGERGYATLLTETLIPSGVDGAPIAGGFVMVSDAPNKGRLIFDPRTPNLYLHRIGWMKFP